MYLSPRIQLGRTVEDGWIFSLNLQKDTSLELSLCVFRGVCVCVCVGYLLCVPVLLLSHFTLK